jgi:hypothetical protein
VDTIVQLAIDSPWEVRKEAIWTICNIITCGKDGHLQCLVGVNGIQALGDVLAVQSDAKLLLVVLDAIEKLLQSNEEFGRNYIALFEECGGIDNLENLQEHPNDDVYEKSGEILRLFFGGDDEEDQNLAPAQEDGTFSFGFPSKELFPAGNEVSSPRVPFSFATTSDTNMC